ncbi:M16 family metallopeptidase [Haloferula rosea]|uniref:Insulinase family protein n=1 Tax=Haloferula rosea TaxID=490093 RepID=A0A934RCH8_9BACT|nr:pitrilysin family protein [Haloferula rosea]MBK1828025.1 insulinase family protein [Haloferula rosea]
MRASYETFLTSNGMRLAFAPLPDSECTAVSIHIPAGSRDDPSGHEGIAHFVEHMSFKGTVRRDARDISLDAENVGASLDAFTSEEQTVYEARGDAETLPLLVDILCDMVWHSTFPAAEIDLEREVIAEEIVMYQEAPGDHITDLLSRALWGNHSLGQPISGSLESIRRIDQPALQKFALRHHRRSDIVIAVAGPHQAPDVLELLEGLLPPSTGPTESPPFIDDAVPTRHEVERRDTQQLQLALAYRSFGRTDPRRHALNLLSMILGEGASSRLFQRLREERGLCYQVSCDASLLSDTGSLEIHAGLDPASRDEAIRCIEEELQDLATHGPREGELARAKRLAASQSRAGMESTSAHASWIGECILHHGSIITPAEALEKARAVTPEQVQAVAREICTPERLALAEIKPR